MASSSSFSSSTPCQFFLTKKGCRNGTACRFSHADQQPPSQRQLQSHSQSAVRAPVRRPVPASLRNQDHDPAQAAVSLRNYEISQVESRFKATFSSLQPDLFELKIVPSDPDFPYEVQSLHIQLTVPLDYPQAPCTIAVLNTDIPKGFAANLERGFAEAAQHKKSLLAHLNWLDINMEQLLQKPPVPTIRFVKNAAASTLSTTSPSTPDHISTSVPTHSPPTQPLSKPASVAITSSSSSQPPPPPPPPGPSNQPTWTKQQIEEAGLQRQKQLAQIQARFRSSFSTVSATEYQIALESADKAHMPVAWQGPLWLTLIVPQKFPLQPCEVRLKQDDHNPEIELWRARNVEQGFRKIVAAMPQLSLFQLLNQVNRDLKDLMNLPAPLPPPPQTKVREEPSSKNESSESSQKSSERGKHQSIRQDLEQDRNPKLIYVDAPFPPGRRNFDYREDQGAVTSEDSDTDGDSDKSDDESVSGDNSDGSTDIDQHDQGHDNSDGGNDEEHSQSQHAGGPVVESGPKRGIEIRMPDLKLEHISLAYCRSLSIQVRCSRCKGLIEIPNLVPDDGRSSRSKSGTDTQKWKTCDQCQSLLGANFRAEFIHAQSRTIGYLDLAGCTAFDIFPSAFVPTCDECDQVLGVSAVGNVDSAMTAEVSLGEHAGTGAGTGSESGTGLEHVSNRATQPTGFKQRIGPGMSATANCRKCHVRMTLSMEGQVKFVKLSPGEVMRASASTLEQLPLKKKVQKNKNGLDFELKVGEPLPRKGACSHYRKSRRWFRFPCCSKIYPCHLCHDEGETASPHECEYAKRMVCGFCSREQTVSDKLCVCGESPVKTSGGSGAFWEGGQGMRDKSRMSNRDSRKHKGSNKTVAKKQVGAENVRKRAPKA
ncbi:MAG: hypothetical protein J3Q66DRAFT_389860 [Benniella sp.]|nr:MAG: hypothetical protein J3Q66DRAFT_389860 [Benniella sp.]